MCSGRYAHGRFQEWTQTGVFQRGGTQGLIDDDERKGMGSSGESHDESLTGQKQGGPDRESQPRSPSKIDTAAHEEGTFALPTPVVRLQRERSDANRSTDRASQPGGAVLARVALFRCLLSPTLHVADPKRECDDGSEEEEEETHI